MSDTTDTNDTDDQAPQGGRLRHPQHHRRPHGRLRRDPHAGRPARRARAREDRRRQRQPLDRAGAARRRRVLHRVGPAQADRRARPSSTAPTTTRPARRPSGSGPPRTDACPRVSAWRAWCPTSTWGCWSGELDERLAAVDAALARHYPGERPGRQPVHTVYVPADRFHAGLVADARRRGAGRDRGARGAAARAARRRRATCSARVRDKLAREPVEDLRIDFEDGYGARPDDEEDADVRRAAGELRSAIDAGTRRRPSTASGSRASRRRPGAAGVRTLALFLERAGRRTVRCRDGFVVTLPKVTAVEQVEALVAHRRAARGRARPRRRRAALRAPGRDARSRSSAPTAPRWSPG